jgi:putative ABC transport system ATP-binding protein
MKEFGEVLQVRGLVKQHGQRQSLVRAVDGIDLDVPAGQMLAVMGPSGCGKSTLLHMLGGLERPTGGEVWLAGERVDTASERALAKLRRESRHLGDPRGAAALRGIARRRADPRDGHAR